MFDHKLITQEISLEFIFLGLNTCPFIWYQNIICHGLKRVSDVNNNNINTLVYIIKKPTLLYTYIYDIIYMTYIIWRKKENTNV